MAFERNSGGKIEKNRRFYRRSPTRKGQFSSRDSSQGGNWTPFARIRRKIVPLLSNQLARDLDNIAVTDRARFKPYQAVHELHDSTASERAD